MNLTETWCGSELVQITDAYNRVYGYVSITICVIGAIGNVLNVLIFAQKKNIILPVNVILLWMSTVDLVLLVIFVLSSGLDLFSQYTDVQKYSYLRTTLLWLYSYISQTLHTMSIWLTITLAKSRDNAVAHPLHRKCWGSVRSTRRVILTGCLLCSLLCAPLLYTFRVQSVEVLVNEAGFRAKEGNSTLLYIVGMKEPIDAMVYMNFIIYSVLLRLLPSILLILLSIRLIGNLTKSNKIRRQLTRTTTKSQQRQMERVSTMILAVLFLFLVNEIPQIVLTILIIGFDRQVLYKCYIPMGDILDTLGLLNASLHFFLYFAISRSFRASFYRISPRHRSRRERRFLSSDARGMSLNMQGSRT